MVYLSTAGAREPGFSPKALSGHGHLVMAVEGAIGSFHSPCKVRPLEVNAGPPGVRDQRCLRDICFRCLRRALSTRGRLGGGGLIDARAMADQRLGGSILADERNRLMNEMRRGLILFRLLVPGGERWTSIDRPRSSPRHCTSCCHARAVGATSRARRRERMAVTPPWSRRRRLTRCF
jgi:hypothetical protein